MCQTKSVNEVSVTDNKNWPRTSWDVGTLQQLKRVVLHEISRPRQEQEYQLTNPLSHHLAKLLESLLGWDNGDWAIIETGGKVLHLTLLLGLFMHRKNTSETQEPMGDNQIFLVIAKHVHF